MAKKKSTYASKGGAHRYSPSYYEWERAARSSHPSARELGERHSRNWLGEQFARNRKRFSRVVAQDVPPGPIASLAA